MKYTTTHIEETKIDISVIIVNYKSWNHLENCLNGLNKIDTKAFSFEVIVVDNCSNDNKLEHFEAKFPEFRFLLNSGNYGFSHGNNFGARNAKGAYFLFLNPDTVVNTTALSEMLELAKSNPDYGIISCSKIKPTGTLEKETRLFPKIQTLFGVLRIFHTLFNKRMIAERFNETKTVIFPDWVSGSIIFISKSWFLKVGGWSEDYWLYLEDVDLCKRVSKANGKIALTRNSQIIHNHGGASRSNVKTAALTKAEVIISKHVYINSHFKQPNKILAQFALKTFGMLFKSILALLGLIFFFIPKLHVLLLLFLNLVQYYVNAMVKGSWLSKRAPNYYQ
ncbi:MAG: glycosyltransferase family 2 protein [Jejuia sp.]